MIIPDSSRCSHFVWQMLFPQKSSQSSPAPARMKQAPRNAAGSKLTLMQDLAVVVCAIVALAAWSRKHSYILTGRDIVYLHGWSCRTTSMHSWRSLRISFCAKFCNPGNPIPQKRQIDFSKSPDSFGSLNSLIGSFEMPDTSNAPFVTSMKIRYGPGWFLELKNGNSVAPLAGSDNGGRTKSLGGARRDGHSDVHCQGRAGRPRSQQVNNDPINVRPFHGSTRLNHKRCSVGTPTKKAPVSLLRIRVFAAPVHSRLSHQQAFRRISPSRLSSPPPCL